MTADPTPQLDIPNFVRSQMKVLAEQVKDLGDTVSKAAIGSLKASKKSGLSS